MASTGCRCRRRMEHSWRGPRAGAAGARDRSSWRSGTTSVRSRPCAPLPRGSRMRVSARLLLAATLVAPAAATLLVRGAGSLDPAIHAQSQTQAPPTRPFVETLASERLGGREAGSRDERAAGDYLAEQLKRLGARPLPGRKDMFQPFEFTAGGGDGGSRAAVAAGTAAPRTFSTTRDVQALSFSDDGEVSGAVVFAGYGIVVPESQGFGYDSFATLDVKDKVVVVLRYFPEDADQQTRGI